MLRKTLRILPLIGLLLSVGLWGLSYGGVAYSWEDNNRLCVGKGAFDWYQITGLWSGAWYGIDGWHFGAASFLHMGRGWRPQLKLDSWSFRHVYIPLWIPTVAFSAYPIYLLTPLHRRRKRRRLGLCVKCGYNLKGSIDRCSECGELF